MRVTLNLPDIPSYGRANTIRWALLSTAICAFYLFIAVNAREQIALPIFPAIAIPLLLYSMAFGFPIWLQERMRPTPLLSATIRTYRALLSCTPSIPSKIAAGFFACCMVPFVLATSFWPVSIILISLPMTPMGRFYNRASATVWGVLWAIPDGIPYQVNRIVYENGASAAFCLIVIFIVLCFVCILYSLPILWHPLAGRNEAMAGIESMVNEAWSPQTTMPSRVFSIALAVYLIGMVLTISLWPLAMAYLLARLLP
jgi:hypothetical protein